MPKQKVLSWLPYLVILIVFLMLAFLYFKPETGEPAEIEFNTNETFRIRYQNDSGVQMIYYEDEGETKSNYFLPEIEPSLQWINENLAENALIVAWWDYGPMIKGYTQRPVLAQAQSREMLRTTAKYANMNAVELALVECNCIEHQIIQDIAKIMLSTSIDDAKQIMNKYNAQYILITDRDLDFFPVFRYAVSLDSDDLNPEEFPEDFTSTLVFRVTNDEFSGVEVIYEDDHTTIIKI